MKDYFITWGFIILVSVFIIYEGILYVPQNQISGLHLIPSLESATTTATGIIKRIGPAEAYPNLEWNPGKLSNLDPNETCLDPNWRTSSIRPPTSYTNALKKSDIVLYKYTDTNMADYELDHICSLEICGDPTDPQNLFPQPYNLTWNGIDVGARIKDKVENLMAKMVKAKQITPQQACDTLRFDWIAIGQKYGIIKLTK